jgi:hypothetical protein
MMKLYIGENNKCRGAKSRKIVNKRRRGMGYESGDRPSSAKIIKQKNGSEPRLITNNDSWLQLSTFRADEV